MSTKEFCWRKSSRTMRAVSRVSWSAGDRESLPTSWTISFRLDSCWRMPMACSRFWRNSRPRFSSNQGFRESRYREWEVSQLMAGKCRL